jgi:hypothetical protein
MLCLNWQVSAQGVALKARGVAMVALGVLEVPVRHPAPCTVMVQVRD